MSRPSEREAWLKGKGIPPGIAAVSARAPQALVAWLRANATKGKKGNKDG